MDEPTRPSPAEVRLILLLSLLQRAWTYSLSTKSDDARLGADEIAEGASRGFLTTLVVPGGDVYGRIWKVTERGLSFLSAHGHIIATREIEKYGETQRS